MKKILVFLTILCTIFSIVFIERTTVFASDIEVSAPNVYLCDINGENVIYSKAENERRPIASMTKIMLLLLSFEANSEGNLDFEKQITVSSNASAMGGSQVFLQANKNYYVKDLIKSIIIASANDASVAIAETLYGSEEVAVAKMNEKAKSLGMNNTLFSNCTGLPKPTQFSSAKDVAIMLTNLLKYDKYYEFSKIFLDELVHPDGQKTVLTNTNKLVRFYEGCDGGKTGYTSEAGFCLAATAKRDGMRIIGVIINEKDSKTRFADCSKLFNYAFANYSSKNVLSKGEVYELKAKVEKGEENYVEIVPESDFSVVGKKNVNENITVDFEPLKIIAPVKKGDYIGKFTIYKNNVKIAEVKALANQEVNKESIFDVMKNIAIY